MKQLLYGEVVKEIAQGFVILRVAPRGFHNCRDVVVVIVNFLGPPTAALCYGVTVCSGA